MNSKAAQLTNNGKEIVGLFARFALGVSFLSAVADRFGLFGPHGAKNVSWGDFAHFAEYTGEVMSLLPSSVTVSFAWAATVAEILFGILLIAGLKTRMASVLSGFLLLSFAMGMATGLGIKTPFDYSVFSAAASAAGAAAPPLNAVTATGAAAETPHFSSSILDSCAASITVKADRSSTNFAKSGIFYS